MRYVPDQEAPLEGTWILRLRFKATDDVEEDCSQISQALRLRQLASEATALSEAVRTAFEGLRRRPPEVVAVQPFPIPVWLLCTLSR